MTINEQKIEEILKNFKRTQVPVFNFRRVRNQILDRIAIPQAVEAGVFGKFSIFAPFVRVGAGIMAGLLIVVSLTLGLAVTALDSVPGSAIYPLKKVVENIQLKLTPDDQKGSLQLKFAGNRAEELQEVMEQKQEGKISDQEASAIVANTVKDLQKTAAAAVSSSKSQSKSTAIVNKLSDISNKLRAASVLSDGQTKAELQKALDSTKISQNEAIKNLEQAGLKVENSPIAIDDTVTASGKLTAVDSTTVSIGTVKFLLTKDTKFVDLTAKDLKIGQVVDIIGQNKDNKAYAVQIKLITETKTDQVKTETLEPDTNTDSQ